MKIFTKPWDGFVPVPQLDLKMKLVRRSPTAPGPVHQRGTGTTRGIPDLGPLSKRDDPVQRVFPEPPGFQGTARTVDPP